LDLRVILISYDYWDINECLHIIFEEPMIKYRLEES